MKKNKFENEDNRFKKIKILKKSIKINKNKNSKLPKINEILKKKKKIKTWKLK